MTHLLEAQSVSFAYEAAAPALRAVHAAVRGGALCGIVGPNGSGKSTLLRLLCGLLRPDAGEVMIDGSPLRRFNARERARLIAYLPQAVNPAFSLTVFEVACLGRFPHAGFMGALGAADFAVVRRSLRDTETELLRNRDFLTLSGGERQRVLLASILAQEPQLILLDEPTSALDIHHEVEVFDLLRRLAERGYGVGVVTHDLNMAAQYCHELILLGQDHTLIAAGPPGTVLSEALLTRAYGAPIRVGAHPFTGTPFVSAVPSEAQPC